MKKAGIIVFVVLLLDQILKIWIKTHMTLGQEFHVMGDWFIIHYIENNGMAFGMEFAGNYGKLALSIFRIIAIIAIIFYIRILVKNKASNGVIVSISLILAGAIGNIIDSAFYGLLFSASSYHNIATFLPEAGGYTSFLYGKVVDMLYFPMIQGYYPDWFPVLGGNDFVFFRPVFNIADSSVTVGVALLLIFQKQFLKSQKKKTSEEPTEDTHEDESTELNAEANNAS